MMISILGNAALRRRCSRIAHCKIRFVSKMVGTIAIPTSLIDGACSKSICSAAISSRIGSSCSAPYPTVAAASICPCHLLGVLCNKRKKSVI